MPSLKRYQKDPEYRKICIEQAKLYYKNHKEEVLKKIASKKPHCDLCNIGYKDKEKHENTFRHKYYVNLKDQNNRT